MSATVPGLLQGYSQALYANWLWYRPFRVLFDAGEGVASRLQNSVFGIRRIFLSHGHLDHLAGLPSIVNIRNSGMGETDTPLEIYHPAGDPLIASMRDYLAQTNAWLRYELSWHPLTAGERVSLDETRTVEAFATRHVPGLLTLGYRILEARRRLRPELHGWSQEAIRDHVKQVGRDAISESFEQPLFLYGGDGLPPSDDILAGVELACLESTFLTDEDRGKPRHATMPEAVEAAHRAGVGTLVLCHLSGRYRPAEMRRAIRQTVAEVGFGGEVYLLWRDRLTLLTDEG